MGVLAQAEDKRLEANKYLFCVQSDNTPEMSSTPSVGEDAEENKTRHPEREKHIQAQADSVEV